MIVGAALIVVWCGACLAAAVVASTWRIGIPVASTVVLAAGMLFVGSRANAMAAALAPAAARGRYLAAFRSSP